ncbi:MAG: hypothetical protein WA441_13390 [Methyloceanibacter sp.]
MPDVTPAPTRPDDYEHINATPESFGGYIAQGKKQLGAGIEQAGQGAVKAGGWFGQVAANQAYNSYQEFADKLLNGDPNQKDAQGNPVPGYLALRGQAAMNARAGVEQALDDKRKEIYGGLYTGESQLQFDQISRRRQSWDLQRIGGHYDQQMDTWAGDNQKASLYNDTKFTADNWNNPEQLQHALADLRHDKAMEAQLQGEKEGSPIWNQKQNEAEVIWLSTRLQARAAANDPAGALAELNEPDNRKMAGARYEELANSFRARAYAQESKQMGTFEWNKAGAANFSLPSSITPDQLHGAFWGQESGNRSNPPVSPTGARGPGQIELDTWAKWARPGERIDNATDNRTVSARILDTYFQNYGGATDPAGALARTAVAY